eukprot:6475174-Amphidinium_carterae.2
MTHVCSVFVVNVYLPSGAHAWTDTQDDADVILAEVELHNKPLIYVCGDWYESFHDIVLDFAFEVCGLHQLQWRDGQCRGTYFFAPSSFALDLVVANGLAKLRCKLPLPCMFSRTRS